MKNLVLSGSKKTGKSFLLKKLLENITGNYDGFLTLRFEQGSTFGYVLHSIHPNVGEDQVIIRVEKDTITTYPNVFDTFGVAILNQSNCPIVVLDELGRIERDCELFKKIVIEQFESDKIVLSILKKENVPWLFEIKKRNDIIFFDLDETDWQDVYTQVKTWFMEEYEKVK